MTAVTAEVMPTAQETAARVRAGEISTVEATAAALERVRSREPEVNAFTVVMEEEALAEAAALQKNPRLKQMPLAGVPVTIKDNTNVAGQPTRNGTAASPDGPALADDELVRRLRAAGCVVIGKTMVSEGCLWPFAEGDFGIARNPWNLDHTPGGSSAGAAAALAAGMGPLALGADGLGSIRIPSAWSGVFGLKPGRGLLPPVEAVGDWFGLSQWGPMATTVTDAALMLDALTATSTYGSIEAPTRPLKIALSLTPPATGVRLDREIRAAVEASADALRAQGHTIHVIDPPYQQRLVVALMTRWLASAAEDARADDWSKLSKRIRDMAGVGAWVSRRRLVKEQAAAGWRRRMGTWMAAEGIDAIMMPSTARTAPRVGRFKDKSYIVTMLGSTMLAPYAAAWNLAGFPAASVPAGLSLAGMPIGVQLVSAPGRESTILSIARQLEQVRPWPRHAPD